MTFSPPFLTFNPGDTINWVLESDEWTFGAQGIAIDMQGSARYAAWPGSQAAPTSANVWSVDAPSNILTEKFTYTINLVNQQQDLAISWDPEMENQPGT